MAFTTYVRNYSRYLLMGVMLLWAITLPGHEVVVYQFVLSTLSGKAPGAANKNAQDLLHRENGISEQAVLALTGAETLPWRLLLPTCKYLPASGYPVFFTQPELLQFVRQSARFSSIARVLQLTNLPNAP